MEASENATKPLERIIEAEATAKKIMEDAEENAKKIIINAQIQAKKNIEAADAEYSAERGKKNEHALKTAEKSTNAIEKKCVEELEALRNTAEKNAKAARDFIANGALSEAGWR